MDQAVALRVIDFWLCIEYLDPPKLEDPEPKKRSWSIGSNREWPWQDRAKASQMLPRKGYEWRTTISCGILDLKTLVSHEFRPLLSDDDVEELPSRDGKAMTIVFTVDGKGRLCGPVSFSSLLWIMGVLTGAKRSRTGIQLGGFAGEDGGFESKLKKQAFDHLITATTVPEKPDDETGADVETSQAGTAPATDLSVSRAEPDPRADLRPVTFEDLRKLEQFILDECGWHPVSPDCMRAAVQTKSFQIRIGGKGGGGDGEILNSFIANDLRDVRRAVADDNVGPALTRYLSRENPAGRLDVNSLEGRTFVARATMPDHLPLGRWPSQHPLVLAQQFAVNAIVGRVPRSASPGLDALAAAEGGMFSVNGPPGTGKTTLLRDVVAAVVTSRADCLAAFEKAEAAFGLGTELHQREPDYTFYLADKSLSGFGIVVASSNNGAVENVSRELPAVGAVDVSETGGRRPDYFAAVADGLLVVDPQAVQRTPGIAWGAIAAVLGNKDNRDLFTKRFWNGVKLDPKKPPPEFPFVTLPEALAAGMKDGSILPWEQARTAYLEARRRCVDRLGILTGLAEIIAPLLRLRADIPGLEDDFARTDRDARAAEATFAKASSASSAAGALSESLEREGELLARLADAEFARQRIQSEAPEDGVEASASALAAMQSEVARTERARAADVQALEHDALLRPGWLQRLLQPVRHSRWQVSFAAKRARLDAANEEAERAVAGLRHAEATAGVARSWRRRLNEAEARVAAARAQTIAEIGTIRLVSHVAAVRGPANAKALCADKALRSAEARSVANAAARGQAEALVMKSRREEAKLVRQAVKAGLDEKVWKRFAGFGETEEDRQKGTPWYEEEAWHLRHEVFLRALDLHKSFIATNRRAVENNVKCLVGMLDGSLFHGFVGRARFQSLWDTMFLVVPVISTTFASMGRQFRDMGRNSLGWLIIDEAGQATPQAAVGGIWRARRTVVVGDPLQLEPICALPERAIELLQECFDLDGHWHPIQSSTQVMADRCNALGTTIGRRWVGAPLRVHRRCLEPMFGVANIIAYDGLMVHATAVGDDKAWLGKSCWIDMPSIANGSNHDIPSQRVLACDIASRIVEQEGIATKSGRSSIYVISPFRSAAEAVVGDLQGLSTMAMAARSGNVSVRKLVKTMAGTVHTFQGKEAEVVVLLLGCSASRKGAIRSFAARTPNLLNVALTRARLRVYVIGDLSLWGDAPFFRELSAKLAECDAVLDEAAFRMRAGLTSRSTPVIAASCSIAGET